MTVPHRSTMCTETLRSCWSMPQNNTTKCCTQFQVRQLCLRNQLLICVRALTLNLSYFPRFLFWKMCGEPSTSTQSKRVCDLLTVMSLLRLLPECRDQCWSRTLTPIGCCPTSNSRSMIQTQKLKSSCFIIWDFLTSRLFAQRGATWIELLKPTTSPLCTFRI